MSVQTKVRKTDNPWSDDPWYMAGTEGTGEYLVVAVSDVGRVGFREFDEGLVRVRIEPSEEAKLLFDPFFPKEDGWKQPDTWDPRRYRYSTVVTSDMRADTVNQALDALKRVSKLEGTKVVYAPSIASRRRRALLLAVLIPAAAIAAAIAWLRRKA